MENFQRLGIEFKEEVLWLQLRQPTAKIVCVEKSDIGFFALENESLNELYISNIYLDKNYRNLGLGSELIMRILNEAKKANFLSVMATTYFGDENINFYSKLNFKEVRREYPHITLAIDLSEL